MTENGPSAEAPLPAELSEIVRRPSVRNLMISRACGSSGAVILAIAMGVLVFDITGSKADLGLVGLAEFLPTFLLVLWAGSLADRVDRRKMAALGYFAEGAVALTIGWYVTTEPTSIGLLLLLTAAYGVARGFVNPASRALPANVVPRHELPRLIPALSMTWQISSFAAPLIASAVYGWSPSATFFALAALDIVAGITIYSVKLHSEQVPSTERPNISAAFDGLRLVRRNPLLRAAIGLDLFAVLLGGVIALAPAIVDELLGQPENTAFWMRSAGGLGAGVTAFALAMRPLRRKVGLRLLQTVAVFGVLTIFVAFSRSLVLTLALFAGLAAADMVSVFVRATIVPLATPDSLRGRVVAVEAVFIGASNELGAAESGFTAEWFGLGPAIVVSGIATIVVVLVFAAWTPELRRLDNFDEIQESE
ncbi:MAG: MFS family permease [Candidatus Poriferisodalaceae bacterium]